MAKVKNGVLGTYSGKLGPVIYYNIYGKDCVRTRPKKQSKASSPAQVIQQQKMRLVNAFLIPFKELLSITLAPITSGRSPYHTALSLNLKSAIQVEDSSMVCFDYSKAILSEGPLPLGHQARVVKEAATYRIGWKNSAVHDTDAAIVMAYDPANGSADFWISGIQRKAETLNWKPDLSGTPLHFWLAFRSRNEKAFSPATYLGER